AAAGRRHLGRPAVSDLRSAGDRGGHARFACGSDSTARGSPQMALTDPVAVYTAATNLEAHLVSNVLNDAGVEAFCLEDGNLAGFSMLGALPEIHRPQVWVQREDVERAQPILLDYEMRQAERHQAETATSLPIQVLCEDCGEKSVFD